MTVSSRTCGYFEMKLVFFAKVFGIFFKENFSRTKVEQVYRSRRQKTFLRRKKKFWIEQACIESSIIIYCFRLKVRLAFSIKRAIFVPQKWLNIRISVALFRQLLRQTWDHKNKHTNILLNLMDDATMKHPTETDHI